MGLSGQFKQLVDKEGSSDHQDDVAESLDVVQERTNQLKVIFPDVFSDGKVNFERLKAALGDELTQTNECYELSWAGKGDARREIQKRTTTTLRPDTANSVNWDATQNLYIEGENLEVLRTLQKAYFGKVKMIYIDPPYNTGNDSFVYPDDYSETLKEYQARTGETDESGFLNKQNLWKKNSKESGQFHSAWLSMMYPRLFLARNLLSEDGVVFISIDDGEVGNLRMMADEIFGESNYIATIANVNNPKGRSDGKFVAIAHEYILAYAKNKNEASFGGFELDETITRRYNKSDDRGIYREIDLRKTGDTDNRSDRPNMFYPFFYNQETSDLIVGSLGDPVPSGYVEILPIKAPGEDGCWRWGRDTSGRDKGLLMAKFMPSKKQWSVFEKDYLEGRDSAKSTTVWNFKDVNSERGSEQFIDLGFKKEMFPRPKPIGTIERLLRLGTNNESPQIVLDFFSGSGTTAQAVLNLNEDDGGNRQFICIQMPEMLAEDNEAYKAGYQTIADIGRARLKKAIKKIEEKRLQDSTQETPENSEDAVLQPLGFNALKLGPSNFKEWRSNIDNAEDLLAQLEYHVDSTKPNSEAKCMVYELLLKMALPITTPVKSHEIKVGDKTSCIYLASPENAKLIAIFFDDVTDQITEYILKEAPAKVVCLNKSFKDSQALTNFNIQLQDANIALELL